MPYFPWPAARGQRRHHDFLRQGEREAVCGVGIIGVIVIVLVILFLVGVIKI